MHDEEPVCVLHGLAYVAEESNATDDGRRVRATVFGERRALDVLHHEPRRTVAERARIIEAGDERMVELGERPLLAGESFASRRREPGVAQNLHGGHGAEVVARRVIDDAHSAFAEDASDAVGAELLADDAGVARVAEH